MRQFNRRDFLRISAAGAVGTTAFATACNLDSKGPRLFTEAEAKLTARPGTPTIAPTIGYSALGLKTPRDGLMYVPTTYVATTPAPLLIILHPTGDSSQYWKTYGLGEMLDDLGVVILATDSRADLWDIVNEGGYSSDPAYINLALDHLFKRCNINPAKVTIAGFSYGGLEAIGLGLANGDFVSKVLAYSPVALVAPWQTGSPKFFISHGQSDPVLLFEVCRDQIAQRLTDFSYDVTFVPFEGGHIIPTDILRQSVEWSLA